MTSLSDAAPPASFFAQKLASGKRLASLAIELTLFGPALISAALIGAAWMCTALFSTAALAEPEWRYTLRPGDTLIDVSRRYLARPGDWPRLQTLNRIPDPYRLQPGAPLRIPVAWLRRQPAPATLVAVTGRVTRGGVVLAPGSVLPAGSVLQTAADSSASLRFADGSILSLAPNSTLALDSVSVYAGGGMADTRLRLQQGRVETRAQPQRGGRFEIRTPSAVAAVRGTHYRVGASADATHQETLAGSVTLAGAKRRVTVAAGQGSMVQAGKPPMRPVPLLPAPELTANAERVDALPLVFTWDASDNQAVAWVAQVAPATSPDTPVAERQSDAPRVLVSDLPDGHYVLRVRGVDAHGLHGQVAEHAFELDARPFAPALLNPGARVRVADPAYSWTGVVGASGYVFEFSDDARFAEPLRIQTTDVTIQLPGSLAPGKSYWRVATVEAGETGPFSAPRTLQFDPLPGPPDLTGALVIEGDSLRMSLPPPASGLVYDAVLSVAADRSSPHWQGTSADGMLNLPRPDAGRYVLSVRSREQDGEQAGDAGPWAARTLDVPSSGWPLLLLLPLLIL